MSQTMKVIKASAGSGKTFTLAKKYIEQILFAPGKGGKPELRKTKDYHQHILAITFTNKATNEMKSRIIKELYILSTDTESSNYYEDFAAVCGTEKLRDAASNALSAILFDYSSFHISTIDSFFQIIMRNFARELDRDFNYDLEIQSDHVIRMATLNFLMALGKDHARIGQTQVEKWVNDYLNTQVNQGKAWSSFFQDGENSSSLTHFTQYNLDKENVREHLDELSEYLSEEPVEPGTEQSHTSRWRPLERIEKFKSLLDKKVAEFKETDWAGRVNQYISTYNIDTETVLASSVIGKIYNNSDTPKVLITMRNGALDGTKVFKSKKAPSNEAAIAEAQQIASEFCRGLELSNLLEDMSKQLSYVGLLGEIYKQLEEYRHDNNVMLIADTTQLINKLIKTSGDAPFIYERMGTWINSYMLDEFQDTSKMQYNNFKPLLKESLSHGHFNLVIGDSKQSIYRFRNADPALFRDKIDEDFNGFIDLDPLQTNYRSLSNIIKFNNDFTGKLIASFVQDYEDVKRTYDGHNQHVSDKNRKDDAEQGMVRVMFKDNSNNELKKIDNVLPILPEYLLELHERFDWKEIIILINSHKDGTQIVNRILEHNNSEGNADRQIPIMSGEMMNLTHSAGVRRIIGLLRFIDLTSFYTGSIDEDLPYDDMQAQFNRNRQKDQKKCMVMSRFVEKVSHSDDNSDVNVGALLNESFAEVEASMKESQLNKSEYYSTQLEALLPEQFTQPMSLVNIVDKLIATQLAQTERKEESLFLHAFQDCVMAFTAKNNGGTVREFLHYWDENSRKLNVPNAGAANAITIMTIHKSKGLEADCVVIPCANWNIGSDGRGGYWIDRKTWLDDGGRSILNEISPDSDIEALVPPIMLFKKEPIEAMGNYNLFTTICKHEVQNDLIDVLNKTYVAFTRPCKELHIFAVGSPLKKDVKTIGHHLEKHFPSMEGVYQVTDSKGVPINGHYAMGQPCSKQEAIPGEEEQNEWINKALPTYEVTINKAPVKLPEDSASMREVGKRLHYMLSLIADYRQCNTVLEYCTRRGIITNKPDDVWNKDNLLRLLNEQFSPEFHDGIVCQWFDPENKYYNERSLVLEDKDHNRANARPDRIVKRGNTYIVVDFKWGGRDDKKYKQQVKRYMQALRHGGKQQVEGYVWYVARKEILPVELFDD